MLDLEEAARTIPWEFITGKIVYENARTRDIVLINGDTKELSIVVKDQLSDLTWHPQDNNFSGLKWPNLNWIIGIGKVFLLHKINGGKNAKNNNHFNNHILYESDWLLLGKLYNV